MAGFLFLILVLSVVFALLPAHRAVIWTGIGLAGVAAVAAGVARYRPARPAAWWLVMVALLAMTVGIAIRLATIGPVWDATRGLVDEATFPGLPDLIYLVAFIPLLVAGVWGLTRSGVRGPDRLGLLDTLIPATAGAVVTWALLISPFVTNGGYSLLEKSVAVAYLGSAVLVLAMLVRLALEARSAHVALLPLVGAGGMLVAAATYGLLQLRTDVPVDSVVVFGWIALVAGWGAAALHPSMTRITAPRRAPPRELTQLGLVALAVVALVAPLALLIEAALNQTPDHVVRRALIVALFLFVLVRLYAAVVRQWRGAAREHGLRHASAALVEATTTDEVVQAVRQAVAGLLPRGVDHQVIVEIGGTVLPAAPGAPAGHGGDVAQISDLNPTARSIHSLPSPFGRRTGVPEAVLRCPLSAPRAVNGHHGALYIAADQADLVELRSSVEVVASQAALALERIRLTEEINRHTNEEYFRTLVQNAADVILIVNDDYSVRYASPSALTVLGVEEPGRLPDLIPLEDWPTIDQLLRELRQDPHVPIVSDWTVLRTDGRRLQAEAVCRDLRSDTTVAGMVVTLRDVTEQRRLQQELQHLAFHDPLTGLANRALLSERLERALARVNRDHTVVGMLVLDVDDLKAINDTLGHAAGDELLIATSKRLVGALRQQDTAARIGGDEFAALVVGVRAPQEVEQIAQRVIASFVEPFTLRGRVISRAVSVGVATTADTRDAGELQRHADLALYAAKSAGKAQWQRYRTRAPRTGETLPWADRRAGMRRTGASARPVAVSGPDAEPDLEPEPAMLPGAPPASPEPAPAASPEPAPAASPEPAPAASPEPAPPPSPDPGPPSAALAMRVGPAMPGGSSQAAQ
jgi:diguanylate cyclase (GGDEF)-like protein/PAS domain S-box-containing protein